MNSQTLQECETYFKKIKINQLINKSLVSKLSSKNSINLLNKTKNNLINGDEDQLNRVLLI